MTDFEEKERRKAVLRYAADVPEWGLALKHRSASDLADCAMKLMNVSRMLLATDAEDRFYPHRFDYGMSPSGYADAIESAEYAPGRAAAALEVVTALANAGDVFPLVSSNQTVGLYDAMPKVQAGYDGRRAELEDLCRKHGMKEVAYQHG